MPSEHRSEWLRQQDEQQRFENLRKCSCHGTYVLACPRYKSWFSNYMEARYIEIKSMQTGMPIWNGYRMTKHIKPYYTQAEQMHTHTEARHELFNFAS